MPGSGGGGSASSSSRPVFGPPPPPPPPDRPVRASKGTTPTVASLPPSGADFSSSDRRRRPPALGTFSATVLSAYDLPAVDARPTSVSLSVLGETVRSGPPTARHRDRNSFKFGVSSVSDVSNGGSGAPAPAVAANGGDNKLVVEGPLGDLYDSDAIFAVEYSLPSSSSGGGGGGGTRKLTSTVRLSEAVRVNETRWVILDLSPSAEEEEETPSQEPPAAAAEAGGGGEGGGGVGGGEGPTLRLKLHLSGPYRPEISAAIAFADAWFGAVDKAHASASSIYGSLATSLPEKIPAAKYLLIPAVPVAACLVALSPVIAGVLVIGLPFFLPLLAVLAAFGVFSAAVAAGLYFSSPLGRAKLERLVGPAYHAFLSTPAGQRVVYDTGPRPTPVTIASWILPDDTMGKLYASLLIDFIGSCSYLLPIAGEGFDLFWAPTQTAMVMAMYDESSPRLKYVSFAEEILPFTDFVPSATIGWVKEYWPSLYAEGQRKVHDLSVVVRGERDALRRDAG